MHRHNYSHDLIETLRGVTFHIWGAQLNLEMVHKFNPLEVLTLRRVLDLTVVR